MTYAAVAQMTSTDVVMDNLNVAVKLIKDASKAGAAAIFLPEATDFISSSENVRQLAHSSEAKSFVKGIRDAAKEAHIWVSVGIHEPVSEEQAKEHNGVDGASCFNTQLLINNVGDITSLYRKTHLFDVDIAGGAKIKESSTTVLGKELCEPIETPLGNVGMLTCYDVRFPEPALRLRRLGAHIITYPSAFAYQTGAAHWEPLLRTRAIETQCYVFAAAQIGKHPNTQRISWGHAMIVDPYGAIVSQCTDMLPRKPTFCMADIDLAQLMETRKLMPLWDQRRLDIYPQI